MFEFSLKSIQYMEKEIFFDEMTAREVAERLALIERLDRERREQVAIVNAITLTLARWSGCAPTDVVRLNAGGTGVLFGPPSLPIEAAGGDGEAGEPGEGEVVNPNLPRMENPPPPPPKRPDVVDEPSFAKASAGKK